MLTGIPIDDLVALTGHDGSAIVPPEDDIGCGWTTVEFAPGLLRNYGIIIATYNPEYCVTTNWKQQVKLASNLWQSGASLLPGKLTLANFLTKALTPHDQSLDFFLLDLPAVIAGETTIGRHHAIAWDGQQCYDPSTPEGWPDDLTIFSYIDEVNYVITARKGQIIDLNGQIKEDQA